MCKKTRYTVDLADLQLIADASIEINNTRQFYVDQPSEQQRLSHMAQRLRNVVDRAANSDAASAGGEGEETRL